MTNILSRDLVSVPGTTFNYNTVSPHIVSNIIIQESGKIFKDYAQKKLFNPLGINTMNGNRF